MNLSDPEILELNELCSAVVDDTLTDAQRSRLTRWLAKSEDARCYYIGALGQSASLYHYAAELQVEEPEVVTSTPIFSPGWLWALPLAACVVFAISFFNQPSRVASVVPPTKAEDFVARVTGSKECQWANKTGAFQPGDSLRRGQRLELVNGFAEITFDSGAQIVIEGPAALDLNSAWDATLRHGVVKASVPPEAIGFSIANESVEVVDLGTEFTMIAYSGGAADVLVLRGEVEARPRSGAANDSVFLRENESRRFAQSGITDVSDRDQKFARSQQTTELKRFAQPVRYVHWSLDEVAGPNFPADNFAEKLPNHEMELKTVSDSRLSALRSEGRWQGALHFDGQVFARAPYPGVSGHAPRTIAFWVKVPEDGSLSSAYAMVAWWAENKRLGSRPVHIGWNRNPGEGNIGVLRTDYSGGFAIGATPLRDGRWHHVAVVFVPGADGSASAEVKQYVDGRLEGEGHPSPPGGVLSTEYNKTVSDTIWLGCRLGDQGPKNERFRGELDELCIADGDLGPHEIVQLMKENKPIEPEHLASAKR